MDIDSRVRDLYQVYDESARLQRPGLGTLTRLRTWDIFERYLPTVGRVADVGGGPGVHAAHLALRGYDVVLLDPVARHVAEADARSAAQPNLRSAAPRRYSRRLGVTVQVSALRAGGNRENA